MYIEQGFASSPPPPTDEEPPFDRLDEEPHYPLTRAQKVGVLVAGGVFGLEGATCIAGDQYVGGGILITLTLVSAAFAKWAEWRDEGSARLPDILAGVSRDKYGQPIDNRGEV
jgi:hypothetical protein